MKSEIQKQNENKYKKDQFERFGLLGESSYKIDSLSLVLKSLSNHYRIKILLTIDTNPNINLDLINQNVGGDFKNISAHTKKLETAGLVYKKYLSNSVTHNLTLDGKKFVKIIQSLL